MAPPYTVQKYMRELVCCLDVCLFKEMRINCRTECERDRIGTSCGTAVSAWVKLWNYCGSRGFFQTVIPHGDFYLPYVRCYEEEEYARLLGELVHSFDCSLDSPDTHVDFFAFRWPYERSWIIDNNKYWSRDIYFEYQLRHHNEAFRVFSRWYNTKMFSVPPLRRSSFYFSVPELCSRLNPTKLLQFPTPFVFSYYSYRIICGTALQAYEKICISRLQFSVLVVIFFLVAADDGFNIINTGYLRIRSEKYGILCSLLAHFFSLI